jgi:dienelactone hydrolase
MRTCWWLCLFRFLGAFALTGCGGDGSSGADSAQFPAAGSAGIDCSAWSRVGDATTLEGSRWTYQSTDDGVRFQLSGVLFTPPGAGPFPGVVVSHGRGGNAAGYSSSVARIMRDWGLVAIATNYTHAPDDIDATLLPQGAEGASPENVQRAHKTRELLSCLGIVDMDRLAAHGHSMGAFVTGQLLGRHPLDFAAASHTAGGLGATGSNATTADAAAMIITPYQLHHGDADVVVDLGLDQALRDLLEESGVPHELHVYGAYTHSEIALDPLMFERVRAWYQAHGVL